MPPATAPPETTLSAAPTTPAAPAAPPKPPGPVKIYFTEDKVEKNVGETFKVTLEVDNARDVISAPFLFQYDPKLLSLDDVAFGKFWSADGEEPLLIKNVQNESGSANIRSAANREAPPWPAMAPVDPDFKALARGGAGTVSANEHTS